LLIQQATVAVMVIGCAFNSVSPGDDLDQQRQRHRQQGQDRGGAEQDDFERIEFHGATSRR
jgi:hypothetical protein